MESAIINGGGVVCNEIMNSSATESVNPGTNESKYFRCISGK